MGSVLAALALFIHFSSAEAKTLTARLIDPPVTLDWNGQATLAEAPIIVNLCEGLFSYDQATKKLVPALAASVKKSKDLTEYTFEIRKDAKWSDGRTVYAQDFVDAWLRLVSPQSTSIYSYYLFGVANAREYNSKSITDASKVGVKATGEKTLVVKLRRPTQNFEATTAFWPLFPIRKDLMEKYGSNWWRAGVLATTGPFVFDSYETGSKVILKRNPHYSRSHSNIDEVDFLIISDHEGALKKYEAKTLAFLNNLPLQTLKDKTKRKDFRKIDLLRHYLIAFNAEKFPFNDQTFRQAILSAIDRKELTQTNFTLANSLIPPPFPGSSKSTAVDFDLKKARALLKQSGVVLSPQFKIRLLTNIAEPFRSTGTAIQSQLSKNLKVAVEVAALQSQEYNAYMNLGDYNIALMSWTAKVATPQDFLLPYSGEALSSRTHFTSPFYDQWLFEGMQANTVKQAAESFFEAQKFLSHDQAVVNPLFFESSGALVSPSVKDLYFDHMGLAILKDVRVQ